jgi:hypothetical protein
MKIKYTNLETFTLLLNSFLTTENLQNHFFSETLVSNFSFRWNFFQQKEKKAEKPLPANALEN